MSKRVVLIGPALDPQIVAVTEHLRAGGVEPQLWDTTDWTAAASPTFSLDAHGELLSVAEGSLNKVGVVWVRDTGLEPTAGKHEQALKERAFSLINQLREVGGAMWSALRLLEDRGVPVINPLRSLGVHGVKLLQLHRFRHAGLRVPQTLVTNDPDAVRRFAEANPDAIYKPVAGGGYARALGPEDLTAERLEMLRSVPVQFQERIVGESVRVYVLGGEVVGAGRMLSEELDYRTAPHDVLAIEPDADMARAAVAAAHAVNLEWSGVDFVVGTDGFHVLEANPSPMFAVFDELAGTSVGAAVAKHLARLA